MKLYQDRKNNSDKVQFIDTDLLMALQQCILTDMIYLVIKKLYTGLVHCYATHHMIQFDRVARRISNAFCDSFFDAFLLKAFW